MNAVELSKFLSFVLRHKPEAIGLSLNAEGWADISELIRLAAAAGTSFQREDLLHVVETSDKKRFTLSADGLSIRAAQGHSAPVSLGLPPQDPPETLYHGTATRFLDAVFAQGLQPQSRRQVHLSADEATAISVGRRHGKPAVLRIAAGRMQAQGFNFFLAENGVWLTDRVPPEYLTLVC